MDTWSETATYHRVLTATAAPTPTQVDVRKYITEQDLESLKKQDPFLYYSIPGVRDATVLLEHADLHQVAQNGLQTSRTSEPVAKVQRCRRLSFECHPDLLLRDLILENDTDVHDDMGNPQEGLSMESLDDPISGLVSLFTS